MAKLVNYMGVFGQRASSLKSWKDDGYNLAVICPEGETKANWRSTAKALGLKYIDTPDWNNLAGDSLDPNLIGWALPDEPRSLRGTVPGTTVEVYNQLCQKLIAANPGKRLFGTFAGTDLTSGWPWYKGDKDIPYFQFLTDLAGDWYPNNRGYQADLVLRQLDLLKVWSNNKKNYWAVLECSDQKLPLGSDKKALAFSPTRESMFYQARAAARWGVEGIIYFPPSPPPHFAYDARNDEQKLATRDIAHELLDLPTETPPVTPLPPVLTTEDRLDRLESLVVGLAKLFGGKFS